MRAIASIIPFVATLASASGIVDIGLIHPQANKTYEPTDQLPLIFAIQMPKLAEHLNSSIWYRVINVTEPGEDLDLLQDSDFTSFNWTNASDTEPYLFWDYVRIPDEGQIRVIWQPRWSECVESDGGVDIGRNHTAENFLVDFRIAKGGQNVDLIADTSDDSKDCPTQGVALNVTDETLETQDEDTCTVVASSSISSSNPCKVKIDEDTIESMEAVDLKDKCRGIDKPSECPEPEEDAASRVAASSLLGLAMIIAAVTLG